MECKKGWLTAALQHPLPIAHSTLWLPAMCQNLGVPKTRFELCGKVNLLYWNAQFFHYFIQASLPELYMYSDVQGQAIESYA